MSEPHRPAARVIIRLIGSGGVVAAAMVCSCTAAKPAARSGPSPVATVSNRQFPMPSSSARPSPQSEAGIPCNGTRCDAKAGEVCCDESTSDGVNPVCKAPPCYVHQLCFDDAPCPTGHRCLRPDKPGVVMPDGYGECHFERKTRLACGRGLTCQMGCCISFDGTESWCSAYKPCDAYEVGCTGSDDCGPLEQCCAAFATPSGPPRAFCRGTCDDGVTSVVCRDAEECPEKRFHELVGCLSRPGQSSSDSLRICTYR